MQKRITLLILSILMSSMFVTGCWNYREVDKLAIVAGVAVDKGTNRQYKVTIEIVQMGEGKDTKKTSKTITTEGNTMFDAVRNAISLEGKRLYWSHAKVIIISKEIASEGLTKVIDWYNRDNETRADVQLIISEGASAQEILSGQATTEEIKSFVLDEMIKNQESLSKAPKIDILHFDNDLQAKGISPIASAISLKRIDGKIIPQIMGTAIFKGDKLIGFLNDEETKDLLFIRNEVKGGVMIKGTQGKDISTPVSLEIFKNKTQVTPIVDEDNNIEINLDIDTTVSLDEIDGTENLIDDEGRMKLENSVENTLKERIEAVITKMQSKYDTDIFGFGAKLREDNNREWKRVSSNWEEIFKDLRVNVTTRIHIRNSAMISKPLEIGE
ncbi:Ger(x)C family spore germination protein [Desulfitobacterium sp. Sab5]|uniref:Ger(x)C family spore germination protein n=1 Tax=Desulfitobacterium nosdiversum TaxID=3375356 RepID=UPI003CE9B2A8